MFPNDARNIYLIGVLNYKIGLEYFHIKQNIAYNVNLLLYTFYFVFINGDKFQ